MGQIEVINFLKENNTKEFTTTEIAELIDLGCSTVTKIMRRLLKDPFETINKRELSLEEKKNRYGAIVNSKIHVYWINK